MLTIYANPQRSFYDHLLEGALKERPLLAKVDAILNEIPDLLEPFIARYAEDRKERHIDEDFGRETVSLESILRLLIAKRLHRNCTWRDIEEQTRTDYAWKAFAKLSVADRVPDHTTLIKWEKFFGEKALRDLADTIISYAKGRKIVKGRRFRTDTTVVPANIHYPTDSSILGDAIRIITRTVKKIKNVVVLKTVFRSRMRSVKKHLAKLGHALKNRIKDANGEAQRTTRDMLKIAKSVMLQARKLQQEWRRKGAKKSDTLAKLLGMQLILAGKLLHQTERKLNGKKIKDRIVSFFQPSMRPIVKGKLFPPCEFGAKLEVDETEGDLISDWRVFIGNPNDATLLQDAVDRHKERFGRDPAILAADRGYWSEENEKRVKERIAKAAIPKRGYKTKQRLRTERSRWFREAQDWRAGGEAKISWLKRMFGLGRSRAKTEEGYTNSIGWGVIGCNLKALAMRS